jgi:hypothetical protein
MKKSYFAALFLVLASALAACGPSKPDVSFQTLEDGRAQARSNAEYNAIQYRSENPRMQGLKIVSHGDTTQTADCPQGSGWATLSIMNVNKELASVEKYKVVCSTVSAAQGCFLEKDFESTPHSKEMNQCNTRLPFPLPKLAK